MTTAVCHIHTLSIITSNTSLSAVTMTAEWASGQELRWQPTDPRVGNAHPDRPDACPRQPVNTSRKSRVLDSLPNVPIRRLETLLSVPCEAATTFVASHRLPNSCTHPVGNHPRCVWRRLSALSHLCRRHCRRGWTEASQPSPARHRPRPLSNPSRRRTVYQARHHSSQRSVLVEGPRASRTCTRMHWRNR